MRRTPRALAWALVLVAVLGSAHVVGSQTDGGDLTRGWEVVLVIDDARSRPDKAFEAFDTASLVLADINGDGQLEIITLNDNNHAYVLDARTGAVLAEIVPTRPGHWDRTFRDLNPISVGALDPSGVPCLVIPTSAAIMSAWCYDASRSTPERFAFDRRWEVVLDAARYEPDFRETHPWMYLPSGARDPRFDLGLDGGALIMDVDGDGHREVFIQTDGYPGQFSFDATGRYRWSHAWFDGNAGAVGLDIGRDGVLDVCFGSDGGVLACYRASDGHPLWTFDAGGSAVPGSIPVAPLVTDVDHDGHAELFFGARNARYNATQPHPPHWTDPAYDPSWINNTHAVWVLLDADGALRWTASYDWMNPLHYNHPAAVDVNGDGVLDLVALDWNTIGHKPGNWQTTARRPNLFVLDGLDGSVVWRQPIRAYWANMDFVIADADGDGVQDIIVPEPRTTEGSISVRALADGARRGGFAVAGVMTRGPVAGDVFGDGTLALVQPVLNVTADGDRVGSLWVIRTNQPFDAVFTANFPGAGAVTADWPPLPTPAPEVTIPPRSDAPAEERNGTGPSPAGSDGRAPSVDAPEEPRPLEEDAGSDPTPSRRAFGVSGPGVLAVLLGAATGMTRRRR